MDCYAGKPKKKITVAPAVRGLFASDTVSPLPQPTFAGSRNKTSYNGSNPPKAKLRQSGTPPRVSLWITRAECHELRERSVSLTKPRRLSMPDDRGVELVFISIAAPRYPESAR